MTAYHLGVIAPPAAASSPFSMTTLAFHQAKFNLIGQCINGRTISNPYFKLSAGFNFSAINVNHALLHLTIMH